MRSNLAVVDLCHRAQGLRIAHCAYVHRRLHYKSPRGLTPLACTNHQRQNSNQMCKKSLRHQPQPYPVAGSFPSRASAVAVLMLDLTAFKHINDSLRAPRRGYRRLEAVAKRIKSCLRASDIVARFGRVCDRSATDHHQQDIEEVSHKPLASMFAPFPIEDNEFNIRGRLGSAEYLIDGDSALPPRASTKSIRRARRQ
jgi:GGDEF domain-containing protein